MELVGLLAADPNSAESLGALVRWLADQQAVFAKEGLALLPDSVRARKAEFKHTSTPNNNADMLPSDKIKAALFLLDLHDYTYACAEPSSTVAVAGGWYLAAREVRQLFVSNMAAAQV